MSSDEFSEPHKPGWQESSSGKGICLLSLPALGSEGIERIDSVDFSELKEKCIRICSELLSKVHQDVLSVPAASCSVGFKSKSTVGMMLSGMVIDNMVMGGPAFNSAMLDRGDIIVQIDHQDVSMDGLSTALLGSDIPGSSVVITVKKCSPELNGRTVDVVLTRMATSFIADRCRMFELYAHMKDSVQSSHDSKTALIVDECIELWTKMLIADSTRENIITNNVLSLQGECASLLSHLKFCVEHLSISPKHTPESQLLLDQDLSSGSRSYESEFLRKISSIERMVPMIETALLQHNSKLALELDRAKREPSFTPDVDERLKGCTAKIGIENKNLHDCSQKREILLVHQLTAQAVSTKGAIDLNIDSSDTKFTDHGWDDSCASFVARGSDLNSLNPTSTALKEDIFSSQATNICENRNMESLETQARVSKSERGTLGQISCKLLSQIAFLKGAIEAAECERQKYQTEIIERDQEVKQSFSKMVPMLLCDNVMEEIERKRQEKNGFFGNMWFRENLSASLYYVGSLEKLITDLVSRSTAIEGKILLFLSECDQLKRCMEEIIPLGHLEDAKEELMGGDTFFTPCNEKSYKVHLASAQSEMPSETGGVLRNDFDMSDPRSEIFNAQESIGILRSDITKVQSFVQSMFFTANSKVELIMSFLKPMMQNTQTMRENFGQDQLIIRTLNERILTMIQEETSEKLHDEFDKPRRQMKGIPLQADTALSLDADAQRAQENEELKVVFSELGNGFRGLVLEFEVLKSQIESSHAGLSSKIYGLNGYLKMMVPRVKLDEARAEIQRGNAEIMHLRASVNSMVSKEDYGKIEDEVLQKNREVERLKLLLECMVHKSELEAAQEEADRATLESRRLLSVMELLVPKSRLDDATEQLFHRSEELQRVQKEMEHMIPKQRFEVLQKQVESMMPKDEFLDSQAQIRRLQSEISWAKTLISDLLSKIKNPDASDYVRFKSDIKLTEISRSARTESMDNLENDSKRTTEILVCLKGICRKVSEAGGNVASQISEVNWMKRRICSVQQRVRYKLECLEKYMKIMIPRQMLDASEKRLSQSSQEIEHLQYRLESMVLKSDMLAAQAEIARLSALLEKIEVDNHFLVPKAQYFAMHKILIAQCSLSRGLIGSSRAKFEPASTDSVEFFTSFQNCMLGVESTVVYLEWTITRLGASLDRKT